MIVIHDAVPTESPLHKPRNKSNEAKQRGNNQIIITRNCIMLENSQHYLVIAIKLSTNICTKAGNEQADFARRATSVVKVEGVTHRRDLGRSDTGSSGAQ